MFSTRGLKSTARRVYYRNPVVRTVYGWLCSLLPERRTGALHLATYANDASMGPLQRDEALLMLALAKTLAPRTVVEFGFFQGHSAFNFLQGLDEDALLVSFDVSDVSARHARRAFSQRANFRFVQKSQTDFAPADVDGRPVELVFLDAAHELDLNQATWRRLLPALAPEAIVAIHDTGLWAREHFLPVHREFAATRPEAWLDAERFAHQPGEREFVNWILDEFPEFSVIHLHSTRRLRHGLTLLQRRRSLPVGAEQARAA
ncbi:MAG: class I SAM-dependent methyltransferase [Pirellulales bacterium]|nr:class I SAM-dependent methyltransferase [Pirellulales bacterium]MBX3434667.1 class I SAM-dependent methyltransferase [Pirellulales bacterium]